MKQEELMPLKEELKHELKNAICSFVFINATRTQKKEQIKWTTGTLVLPGRVGNWGIFVINSFQPS